MDIETLENLCRTEFKPIKGLYHPTDTVDIKFHGSESIGYIYRSQVYSKGRMKDDNYENSTRIDFYESSNNGGISLLLIHPLIMKRGFERKMVEAVERILKKRRCNAIWVDHVINTLNPDFWKHLGYSSNSRMKKDLDETMRCKPFQLPAESTSVKYSPNVERQIKILEKIKIPEPTKENLKVPGLRRKEGEILSCWFSNPYNLDTEHDRLIRNGYRFVGIRRAEDDKTARKINELKEQGKELKSLEVARTLTDGYGMRGVQFVKGVEAYFVR